MPGFSALSFWPLWYGLCGEITRNLDLTIREATSPMKISEIGKKKSKASKMDSPKQELAMLFERRWRED